MIIQNKRKAIVIVLVLLVVLAGAGYAGYREYISARQARLIAQAKHYIAKPDYRKALLCLQRALKDRPKDIEATRLMADLTDAVHSPRALMWRSRVVELVPHSLPDRLAMAQTALTLREYAVATNALAGVDSADVKTIAYQNLAGAAASSVNHLAEAEEHFLEAQRLDPKALVPQMNLAIVRLHETNANVEAEARKSLQTISVNPTNGLLRCMALRELVADAVRWRQTNAALSLSQALVHETNAINADKLLRLEALKEMGSPDFNSTLASYEKAGATDFGMVSELGLWEVAKLSPAKGLSWLQSLPMTVRTNESVEMLTAECLVTVQNWTGLHAALTNQNWADLEFVRHAFISRAMRGEGLSRTSKSEWEQAVKAANGQQANLTMLARFSERWGWESESEDLLWTIATRFQNERWAVAALSEALQAGGRTRPLMSLYNQEVKRFPSDLASKNNVAITALLLDAKELKPNDLAKEVYEKVPTNPSFVSTYAFSLHTQGKDSEALKVIERLKPEELTKPSIAGYYGVILKATGDQKKAKIYLDLALKTKLLPEEQILFNKARMGI